MAYKQLIVSDMSEAEIEAGQHAQLTVEVDGLGPRLLDVTAEEAGKLADLAIRPVQVTIEWPDATTRTIVLDAQRFADAFREFDVEQVLQTARQPVIEPQNGSERPSKQQGKPPRGRVDYASMEHAGEVHRGRVTEAEAEIVRNNLEAVNARLTSQGRPVIDSEDPVMKKRYGF